MTDPDREKEDEVLRRMLATKPAPHKPKPPQRPKGEQDALQR